ncbi:ABC transporter ATP-binding protein [Streptosporangium violaceochromogenes]|nr:ABC transporter ATP-binding protein [Streptosporangium violaceochromogenes]
MTEADVVLRAVGVHVAFGGLRAVDNVDLEVRRGELLAIVGPNGAGKTTLFNVLAGALRPTKGSVLLDGEDITRQPSHRRAKAGISRTFQHVRPFLDETVLRNVAVAALANGHRRAAADTRAAELLERVGLGGRLGKRAGELGLGERKRLELARALALEPKVLLLDEVMAGLNPVEVQRIGELLQEIRRVTSVNIVLIEHLLKVVHTLADRVVVLDAGAVLVEGTPAAVFRDERVIEAYLGRKYAAS